MASVEIKSKFKIGLDEILQAIAKLEVSELEKFLKKVEQIVAQKNKKQPSNREEELIQKISQSYPSELKNRYDELNQKMKIDTLSSEEYNEMIELSDQFETLDSQRLKHLIELSELRNTSLESIIKEFKPQSPSPSNV